MFKNAWETVVAIIFVVASILVALYSKEIAYNFTHNFWNAGIWQIILPLLGLGGFYLYYKKFSDDSGSVQGVITQAVSAFLLIGGLIGPAAVKRSDRNQGIPDVNVWITKGKPINVTDSTKANYFFSEYKVSPEDSIKIVETGLVPESIDLIQAKIDKAKSK